MGLPTLLRKGSLRPGMGESQEELDKVRPIDYIVEWFRKKDASPAKNMSDRFVVALSTTGTGKSTTLPAELYLRLFKDKNIVVTQPRIVTTIDIPKTISNVPVYKSLVMGSNIGYQTADYVKKPIKKGILFTTIGVLLQQLKTLEPKEFVKKYKVIILDEAHERSTDLDLVFYYIKNISRILPIDTLPFVVCASGTMDIELYKKYFNTQTVFIIQGDSYPIRDHFLKYDSSNLMQDIVSRLTEITKTEGDRHKEDIVLFVPTTGMMSKIKKAVKDIEGLLAIGLDSAEMKKVASVYINVFDNIDTLPGVKKKLIMGTNSIETGITLESISYCIDTGFVNSVEYNPVVNIKILMVKPVTKAMAMQRRGRVGRIQEGSFFPMYSKESFELMQDIQFPAMITTEMTLPLLSIICANPGCDVKKLDTMAELPSISISNSLNKLMNYGLIAHNKPTDLGNIVNKFRQLSLENILLLLSEPGSIEMVIIVVFLTLGRQTIVGREFKSFDISHKVRKILSCDWLEFLITFEKAIEKLSHSSEELEKYCEKVGFVYEGVIAFIELKNNIMIDVYNSTGFKFSTLGNSMLELTRMYEHRGGDELSERVRYFKELFLEAYKMNLAICIKDGMSRSLYYGIEFQTPNATQGSYVLYDSIILRKDRAGNMTPSVVNGYSIMNDVPVEIPELFT